ncbi:6353_t:CDS:10 [Acaulospora morrowiae]|uniref:Phospholipase n=1 Tax=Acaulospora morrowiae TaxID=94023 RepID=A0A9N8VVY5_9GLOM|nr:6353_t:CDS:10 [Acaulospora morrowiae]
MSESNEQNGSASKKPESVKENGVKVELDDKTMALLKQNKNMTETQGHEESIGNQEIPIFERIVLNKFYSFMSDESPSQAGNSHAPTPSDSSRQVSRRYTTKRRPVSITYSPSAARLSAPYIEEQRPERPEIMKHLSNEQIAGSSVVPEAGPSEESEGNTRRSARESLKASVRKAINLANVNKMFATFDNKEHLQTVESMGVLTFPSAMMVPFLWMRRDHRGKKALAITDSYVDEDSYNWQSTFRIELEYGDVKWVVKRTGFDFIYLHVNLSRRAELPPIPKFPSGLSAWFKTNVLRNSRFQESALGRRKELENYLLELIKLLSLHVSYDLYEFLELSAISITTDMGWKGKECYMLTKVERLKKPICSFIRSSEKWEREWVIVRDSYIAFCRDISDTTPVDVFLLDKHFKCEKLMQQGFSRILQLHDHISIENSFRRIEIKSDSRHMKDFLESIDRIKISSPWVKQHRFDSFAPIREDTKVKWYVDGKDYFYAVSQALLAARSEIYIEDWWLSPELYLRRPPSENEEFRLDRLLKKKAEEGVMIYIVVYKEVSLALTLDSHHTKFYLQDLHKNIKVQRHPDHIGIEGTVFWAVSSAFFIILSGTRKDLDIHHEKMVVVDSRIAFIGGLDLCFGRYDTHAHELSDYNASNENPTIWPGQDFSNPRIKDFQNVSDFNAEIIDKSQCPRMPWHDVSIGMVGTPARDVARHFVERWNFVKEEKSSEREDLPFLTPKGEYVSTRDESQFKGTCKVQVLRSSAFWSSGVKDENSVYNAYCECIRSAKHFIYIENQFFVTSTENDPDYAIKNRIGGFLVERIVKAHHSKEKFRVIVVMPLLPAFEAELKSKDAGTIRMVMHWQYVSICRDGKSVLEKISSFGINPEDYISFFALRNYGKIFHSGKDKGKQSENSILRNSSGGPVIPNGNLENGSENIIHSQENTGDSFSDERVHIAPNSVGSDPAMPAGVEQTDPNHNYVTEEVYIHSKLLIVDDRCAIIGSGLSQLGVRDSEIAIIVEDMEKVDSRMDGKEYKASKFAYTLRSNLFKEHLGLIEHQDHSTLTKSCLPPLQPEILLDLLQDKDNKLGTLIDEQASKSPNKHPTKHDLVVMDPLSDEFYAYWQTTANHNTDTYRSVFRCVPDDNVVNWESYDQFVPDSTLVPTGHVANSKANLEEVKNKLSNIRGHLVNFPLHFLEGENLFGSVISNAVTPVEIFT